MKNMAINKRLVRWFLLTLVGVAMTEGLAIAQTNSGFSFLKIGVGARPIGLGSAYTAMANDATAIYWNPAGLGAIKKRELSAMHGEWLLGSNFDFLGVGYPSKIGALGFGMSMLSHPEQEGRDEQGRRTGNFSSRSNAFTLALSRPMSVQTHLGLGVKLIQSQIGQDKGQGFALDAGGLYHMTRIPISLGLSIQNLGPGIRFINEETRLPLTLASGLAWHGFAGVALAADFKYRVYDQKTNWALGTEYG
ncbi:MAG: PorV/PorQ family protein, partial [Elusimicrobia bacterium]|nr:PorV/PorQ family protein [Elusimicrobiota bacterium]